MSEYIICSREIEDPKARVICTGPLELALKLAHGARTAGKVDIIDKETGEALSPFDLRERLINLVALAARESQP